MAKDQCAQCLKLKDTRAKKCRRCAGNNRSGSGKGRYLMKNGYISVRTDSGRWMYEHRLVMQRLVGRTLTRKDHVHHLDGCKTNNAPENLQLLDESEHHRSHMTSEKAAEMSKLGHRARWGNQNSSL